MSSRGPAGARVEPLGELAGHLAQEPPELALELADARLPRVGVDHHAQGVVADRDFVLLETTSRITCRGTRYCRAIASFSCSV